MREAGTIGTTDRLSLGSNFRWSLAGQLTLSVCTWLTLVVVTRLGSPDALGEYALAAALVAPLFTLSLLHLSTLQATDIGREHSFGDYLALRIWATGAACVFAAGLAWHYRLTPERSLAIVAISIGLAGAGLSGVCSGAFRRLERLDLSGRSMVVRSVGALAALTATLYATGSLVWALAAAAAVRWGVALTLDLPAVRTLLRAESPTHPAPARPRWNAATSLGIALTALPVGLVMMLADLHVTVPRLVIESLLGTHGLGIFVAVAAVAGLSGTVARAGAQAIVPRFAALHRDGDTAAIRTLLSELTRLSLVLGAFGVAAAVVAGEPVLRLVYDAEHARHADLLTLFAVGTGLTYVLRVHASALMGMRRFREQALLRAIQLAFLIGVCPPLTLRYGLVGAACSLLLSEGLSLVMHRGVVLWYLGRSGPAEA